MKDIYNRIFSKITSTKSDNELFNAVVCGNKKHEEKSPQSNIIRRTAFIPIAAALILSISVFSVSGGFEGIKHLISDNGYAENPNVADKITSNIFSDENKHIRVSVEEFLTDNQQVFAVVHYESISDVGKNWLEAFNGDIAFINLKPEEQFNYYFDCNEITSFQSESDKYYDVFLRCSSEFVQDKIDFHYYMPDDKGNNVRCTTELEVSNSVERVVYKMCGDNEANEYYTPKYISISSMSYSIYGFALSNVITDTDLYEQLRDEMCPVLIMSDSSRIELARTSYFQNCSQNEQYGNSNFAVVGGPFVNSALDCETVNPNEAVAIELNGVYYKLILSE